MCSCIVVWYRCSVLATFVFFFQAEDGIRDLVRSRGLGDVYKRQWQTAVQCPTVFITPGYSDFASTQSVSSRAARRCACLLYTSDAADERSSVDLGGRRIIKKKKSGKVWRGKYREQ